MGAGVLVVVRPLLEGPWQAWLRLDPARGKEGPPPSPLRGPRQMGPGVQALANLSAGYVSCEPRWWSGGGLEDFLSRGENFGKRGSQVVLESQ